MRLLGAAPSNPSDLVPKSYVDLADSQEQFTTELPSFITTLPRYLTHSEVESWSGMESGVLCLMYVRPKQNRTISTMYLPVATPAGGTPSVARLGVYSVDGSGNLTLLASTAHDAALVTTGWGTNSKSLNTSVSLTAGSLYAFGFIVVTSSSMPILRGKPFDFTEAAVGPRITGRVTGKTDLPSFVDYWNVWTSGAGIYMRAG